ncbi:HNH endonuclease [Exiguobacterium artemiae]|uniref:HNH endonuclease n=1 Tax=Exiguobacterium artemiae TaxID=340145 RepID=UPI0012696ED6
MLLLLTKNLQGHHLVPRSKSKDSELNPNKIVIICKYCNLQLKDSGIVDWDRAKEERLDMNHYLQEENTWEQQLNLLNI